MSKQHLGTQFTALHPKKSSWGVQTRSNQSTPALKSMKSSAFFVFPNFCNQTRKRSPHDNNGMADPFRIGSASSETSERIVSSPKHSQSNPGIATNYRATLQSHSWHKSLKSRKKQKACMVSEDTALKSRSKRQKPPRENRNQRSRFGSRSVAFNPPPECRFFNNIDIGDCDTKTRVRYLSQR